MSFPGFYGFYLPELRDRFDRADGVLGPQWGAGEFAALQIISQTVGPTTGGENSQWWNGQSASDMGAAYTITTFSSVDYGHYVYVWNGSQGYQVYILNTGANVEIYQSTNSILPSQPIGETFVQGDRIGLRLTRQGSDTRFRLYRQAAAVGSWSAALLDYLHVGGLAGPYYGGIGFYGNLTGRSDDFLWSPILGDASDAPRRPSMRSRGTTW